MTSETLKIVLAWGAGTLLGTIFYGGLWWTVRRAVASRRPAPWFFGSLMVRMSIALAGLYLVAGGRWERLLACLLGLVMMRPVITWRTRSWGTNQASRAAEAGHAP